MNKYKFERFNKNIFILNYNDNINNIIFKKLIKIPITLELYDMTNEYNNYVLIDKKYINYFEKIDNIYNYKNIDINQDLKLNFEYNNLNIEIIINIKNIIEENIISSKILVDNFMKKNEYNKIENISFLLLNYNENNITLSNFFNHNKNNIHKIISLIDKCLYNIDILHKNINFIHGDFKLNNILYDKIINDIYFIDLEFSIITNNKFMKIKDIRYINLYLALDKNLYITIDFLKFFDIYLFTFTFFMSNTIQYSSQFIMYLIEYKSNNSFYYYIFYILYKLLYRYCINNNISFTNINEHEFYKYCKFKNICKIYYDSELIEFNDDIQNVLDYIDNMFDEVLIKNDL